MFEAIKKWFNQETDTQKESKEYSKLLMEQINPNGAKNLEKAFEAMPSVVEQQSELRNKILEEL